jgi:Na+-translocating ferredoxin:NAD+ oxidoreductase RnfA subunit
MNIRTALIAFFAGLSMNLALQCGLGIRGIVISLGAGKKPPFVKMGILFITVFLLWIVFSCVIFSLPLGFFGYIFLFPLSSAVYFSLEYVTYRFVVKKTIENDGAVSFCDGLAAAALFITLNIAGGFVEAAVLSFSFTLGILLVFVILGEIRRRSMLEDVPHLLRGTPLSLISMGFMSLIFASAAILFFRTIGG